jgi:ANTAR domain/GAF domain
MRDDTPEAAEARLNRLLNYILETSVDVLGFDGVTVTARHDGQFSTVAATDQRLIAVDEAQYAANDGPCVTALEPHDPVVVQDVRELGEQWRYFADTASHVGVVSSMSVHVPVEIDDVEASMNFYARRPFAIDQTLAASAKGFAQQVGESMVALEEYRSAAELARNLAEAMKSRATIEQAKGILMAERNVDPDEAFRLLTHLSQRSNTKLRDVAARIVEGRTGTKPSFE